MSFWSRLTGSAPNHEGIMANDNVPAPEPGTVGEPDWNPGDPDGVAFEEYNPPAPLVVKPEAVQRSATLSASPWSGWPAEWSTPNFGAGPGFGKLVDAAWACLDLNASILATMPPYRLVLGEMAPPTTWMLNPDPSIYTSWEEFAKQIFWDYQMGEAFLMPSDYYATGWPSTFRVIPPWLVNVELTTPGLGIREYRIGGVDVTDDILHIRYRSTNSEARGQGPLEAGGMRMVTAAMLTEYTKNLASTGGQTHEWITTEQKLNKSQADDLLEQYIASRMKNLGFPAVFSYGADLKQAQNMSAKDMALLELSQHSESRIAVLLGVPPFLAGLPSGGDSMTYSNVSQIFDFHVRSSLRSKGQAVMSAISQWALPRGQQVELNRDEYSRPDIAERSTAYVNLHSIEDETGRVLTASDIRDLERLRGNSAAARLTGGDAPNE